MMKLVQVIMFVTMLVLAALMHVNAIPVPNTNRWCPPFCGDNPKERPAEKVVENLADAVKDSRW